MYRVRLRTYNLIACFDVPIIPWKKSSVIHFSSVYTLFSLTLPVMLLVAKDGVKVLIPLALFIHCAGAVDGRSGPVPETQQHTRKLREPITATFIMLTSFRCDVDILHSLWRCRTSNVILIEGLLMYGNVVIVD